MLARYDAAASKESITDRESSGPASALVGRELGVALIRQREAMRLTTSSRSTSSPGSKAAISFSL